MNNWRAVLLSLLVLGLTAVGCGGEDEEGGGAQTPKAPADTGSGSGGAASGGTVQVGMEDIEYVPKDVKVKVGGTVNWTNSDSLTHKVTKQGGPGPKFDSGNMKVGAKFRQKFDEPGKIDYFCTIHPSQTGTVTVE